MVFSEAKAVEAAPKPEVGFYHLVRFGSIEKDIVLDPFIGSGTTAVVCKQLSRNFIGFEINEEYVKIANKRLEQTNLKEMLGGLKK